jgi:hypothetical protein
MWIKIRHRLVYSINTKFHLNLQNSFRDEMSRYLDKEDPPIYVNFIFYIKKTK